MNWLVSSLGTEYTKQCFERKLYETFFLANLLVFVLHLHVFQASKQVQRYTWPAIVCAQSAAAAETQRTILLEELFVRYVSFRNV